MSILEHLDKNNLHHAYLIEGNREEILPDVLEFCESLKIKTSGNPDFSIIRADNLKIDEAFDLRAMSSDKGFSQNKKVFIFCINSFTLDAQNVLLKMFEEPIENTHFFLILPDMNALLKTLVSRFYIIRQESGLKSEIKEVENFLAMNLKDRIDFLKLLLADSEEEGNELVVLDSARSKSIQFLNTLEFSLHKTMSKVPFDVRVFKHLFKVREFLRMPGSSTKTLMESVAIIVPSF